MPPWLSRTMSAGVSDRSTALAASRWQLWVDRGGGYDILQGERFSIGGPGGDDPADIAVRCQWSRRAATLVRSVHGDWLCRGSAAPGQQGQPLGADQELCIDSDAAEPLPKLRYRRPCPLSGSAVVTVMPPYRFCGPVDATILLDQTLLLGPESFNHIQVPALSAQGWVLLRRGEQWWIQGTKVPVQRITVSQRWQHEDWSLMIREV